MMPTPILESHGGIVVVRDDLLPGGTKSRAMLALMLRTAASEFVYASPAQGYAQVALAHTARTLGRRATVFTAKRKGPHALTRQAHQAGAKVVMVPFGRLNVVQARARAYAQQAGACLLPFGADDPVCIAAIAADARRIAYQPAEVWCVAGSGVLTRALQLAWPKARHFAVLVGTDKASTGVAERIRHPQPFEDDARVLPPFPSASNYDAKAWEYVRHRASPGALLWNVGR